MNKLSPTSRNSMMLLALLSALLVGCASPAPSALIQTPPPPMAQAPADLMTPAPPPSSFLTELKAIFSH